MTAPDFPVVPLRKPAQPVSVSAWDANPPTWLTEQARTIWEQLAPHIDLCPASLLEFACYCEALAEFQEATAILGETGLLVIDAASGAPVPNPISAVRDRADRKVAAWAARFRS
ncbi:P27 family phage terminase small subunit [Nocardia transvalensis]|uniref:P27 family phage terminase small subunit n=1 Tax=Nocardia transvalensis TaxID=37333 RepID=UPI00189468FC|nr:P27 family phage terminase small subunit [Nocardia transvalensis]MBF6333334.1 P27 family phage terminase small subunit [Nocardia transvalensis]